MMVNLTFTVVIPFYKNKIFLEKILELLFVQTKIPDEIIVIDDELKEDIRNIIQKFKVNYFRQPKNSGVASARNKGLQLSSSDITIFLDSDAIPEPMLIQAIDNIYNEFGEDFIGVGGRSIECRILTKYDRWRAIHLSQDFGYSMKLKVPYLYGVCCSYKTKILLEIGGFDTSFNQNVGEDYELGIRLNKMGYKLFYSPNIVVNHQHMDSLESLIRSQYLWSYWGYKANDKGRISTIFWLGHLSAICFSFEDLIIHRDFELFMVGIKVFTNKFVGLFHALRNKKND